ncbi:MAG: class II aldolase/adducin family protein, partial [Candidatus Saccharicenans sp.]
MYQELKKRVWEANLKLLEYGLAILTFGNVSEVDREKGVMAIKPSGVSYEKMTPEDIVVLDLNGRQV